MEKKVFQFFLPLKKVEPNIILKIYYFSFTSYEVVFIYIIFSFTSYEVAF